MSRKPKDPYAARERAFRKQLRQEIARIPAIVAQARATLAEFDAELERLRQPATDSGHHVVLDARVEGDTVIVDVTET